MLVSPPGQSPPSFVGHTLVIPTTSAGFSAMIGLDMYILNEGFVKAGWYKSFNIGLGISNDALSLAGEEGKLVMPCEIWTNPTQKLTFFMLRSGHSEKKGRAFTDELKDWVKASGISQVLIFSACVNPIRMERESNRV